MSKKQLIEDLTLILLYLTSFQMKEDEIFNLIRAWKTYDFNTLNNLDKKGYISQSSYQAKSLYLDEKGIKKAKKLIEEYHLLDNK